jgi:O-acetyl-ADP-ribose deacetylase (regulator of RNase III)
MPIEFVKGDLLASPKLAAIAHGCNCAGAMGKGIAMEMRNRWPRMYDEYRSRCHEQQFKLGDVFVWEEGGTTIFNLGTQRSWKTRAELPAIKQSLDTMLRLAEQRGIKKIGLPKIGAGLGGLNWAKVKGLLHEIGNHSPICLIVFEQYEPAMHSCSDMRAIALKP